METATNTPLTADTLRILILEDSDADFVLLRRAIEKGGIRAEFVRVDTIESLRHELSEAQWHLVLADYTMPKLQISDLLEMLRAFELDLPVIMVSGVIGDMQAVDLLKAGAHDFILKEDLSRLVPAMERELHEAAERSQRRLAEQQLRASQSRYRHLFNASPVAICEADFSTLHAYLQQQQWAVAGSIRSYRNGNCAAVLELFRRVTFLDANPAAMEMFAVTDKRKLLEELLEYLKPTENESMSELIVAIVEGRSRCEIEICARDADDTPLELLLAMHIPSDSTGFSSVLFNIIDITERVSAQKHLRQAAAVYESTAEGVIITDTNGCIQSVNRAFTTITGYSEQEVAGQNPSLLRSDRQDVDFFRSMWAQINETGRWQGEIWNQDKQGRVYPEWLTISAVVDGSGQISNYIGVFADITELKFSAMELEHLAHHDALTGLPNRLLFTARLQHALEVARREQRAIAVLFMDLDRFKNVNDSLGHPMGDQLLQEAGQRLLETVREEDTVARFSGDEFALIIESAEDEEGVAVIARKLLQAILTPFDLNGNSLIITASLGIACHPEDGDDPTALLKNADAAMYEAKAGGRNTFRFYQTEMTQTISQRLRIETALRQALENDELELWYQPQIAMAHNKIIGAEALLRWHDPERGLIMPGDFIPLAEETGLIIPIGEWAMLTACNQLMDWQRAGMGLESIAVNVSRQQIEQGNIVAVTEQILEETGLEPKMLELEVTESLIMYSIDYARQITEQLRELGVKIAIDDFGTGYSSLSRLKGLAIDRLKIDQAFVRGLPDDSDDVAITRAIIGLSRNLGFSVIAEGVETAAHRQFLADENCTFAQGYFYARPMPAKDFAAWVTAQ